MYYRSVDSFDAWRAAARPLLKRFIPPQMVTWEEQNQTSLVFDSEDERLANTPVKCEQPKIPKEFFQLAKNAAAFRDEAKWSILYSVAWRLVYEDNKLLGNKIDPDISVLMNMRKAIGRDIHKMEAFVRFQRIDLINRADDSELFSDDLIHNDTDQEYFVAWFEPEHLIVPLAASFFIKRFTNMNWSILTPDCCAHWDQQQLRLTEGVDKGRVNIAKTDELESMWLAYYRHIFNPARLKLKAMQSEMPKKYWKNLPEAALIKELTSQSTSMMENMISESQTDDSKKTSKSKYVQRKQQDLRTRRAKDQQVENKSGHV